MFNNFDEDKFLSEHTNIIDLLLIDRTTEKNIIWGTDHYIRKGYHASDNINSIIILGKRNLIKPRVEKSKNDQSKRSKDMAEVFTPSWICNNQNNLIDNAWFGYEGTFNKEDDKSWVATSKVEFKDKNWKDYVSDTRLEITCGEAPYLVSRYDTVTGERIELKSRIGLLDRKFRVINENAESDDEWKEQSIIALKNIYGYEYQGDNLFIARKNIFFSYLEYYFNRFNILPNNEELNEIATIISWNLWQMDGLKFVVPESCENSFEEKTDLFGEKHIIGHKCLGCEKNDIHKHNGKYAKIMDWEKEKATKFINLLKGV